MRCDLRSMTDESLRRSIRAIGIFQYFISFMLLLAGLMPYVLFFRAHDLPPHLFPRLLVVGLFVIGFAVFYFLLARSLRQLKPWARTVTMVISCIGLFGFPIGTIIHVVFLCVLVEGKHLFRHDPETPVRPPPIPIDQRA